MKVNTAQREGVWSKLRSPTLCPKSRGLRGLFGVRVGIPTLPPSAPPLARPQGADGLRPRCGPAHAPGVEAWLAAAFTGAFHDARFERKPQRPIPRIVQARGLILEVPDRVGGGGGNARFPYSPYGQRRAHGVRARGFPRRTQGPRPRRGRRRRLPEPGMRGQRYSRA